MNVTTTSFIFLNKYTNDDYICICELENKLTHKADIDVAGK